jgi:hypothetical protein
MPKGFALVGGMVLFAIAMSALVAWLVLGGVAGNERGLVFKNLTAAPVELRFQDGRVTRLAPDAEQTLPVKRSQFPQTFSVYDTSGRLRYGREYRFEQFKDFEFRIGVGDGAFVTVERPTTN